MTSKTKTQRAHLGHAVDLHDQIESDLSRIDVPDAWHDIWRTIDDGTAKRQEIALEIDADVIRFFKSLGADHSMRINRVLRAFMHDRLAGLIAGPEDRSLPEDLAEVQKLDAKLAEIEGD